MNTGGMNTEYTYNMRDGLRRKEAKKARKAAKRAALNAAAAEALRF
jgi:hypothetical protein